MNNVIKRLPIIVIILLTTIILSSCKNLRHSSSTSADDDRTYYITFVHDGENIVKTVKAHGSLSLSDVPNPKPREHYEVIWDVAGVSLDNIVSNITINARYVPVNYEVKWLDYDDQELEVDLTPYNSIPSYDGDIPQREKDIEFEYTFDGWDKDIRLPITSNTTFKAQYRATKRQYTVTFSDGDTTIKSEQYDYGAIPSFDGTPTKASTQEFDYAFDSWDKEFTQVTKNVTYTAIFTSTKRSYQIRFVDGDNDDVLIEEYTLEYGSAITAPLFPTSSVGYHYEWDIELAPSVTGNTTYKRRSMPNTDTLYKVQVLVSKYSAQVGDDKLFNDSTSEIDIASDFSDILGLDSLNQGRGTTDTTPDFSYMLNLPGMFSLDSLNSSYDSTINGDGTTIYTFKYDIDFSALGFTKDDLVSGYLGLGGWNHSASYISLGRAKGDGDNNSAIGLKVHYDFSGKSGNGTNFVVKVDHLDVSLYSSIALKYAAFTADIDGSHWSARISTEGENGAQSIYDWPLSGGTYQDYSTRTFDVINNLDKCPNLTHVDAIKLIFQRYSSISSMSEAGHTDFYIIGLELIEKEDNKTVTFKDSDKEITIKVNSGGTVIAPNWEKEGYTLSFDHPLTNITEDLTINAIWTLNNYTITYVLGETGVNNISNPSSYTIESETIILLNPTNTNPDLDFVSWEEGNTIPSGSTGNKTFTATWKLNNQAEYKVNIYLESIEYVLDHIEGQYNIYTYPVDSNKFTYVLSTIDFIDLLKLNGDGYGIGTIGESISYSAIDNLKYFKLNTAKSNEEDLILDDNSRIYNLYFDIDDDEFNLDLNSLILKSFEYRLDKVTLSLSRDKLENNSGIKIMYELNDTQGQFFSHFAKFAINDRIDFYDGFSITYVAFKSANAGSIINYNNVNTDLGDGSASSKQFDTLVTFNLLDQAQNNAYMLNELILELKCNYFATPGVKIGYLITDINMVRKDTIKKVTFKDVGREDVIVEVLPGETVTPPEWVKDGYILSFDHPLTNITEDITINAIWTEDLTKALYKLSIKVAKYEFSKDNTNGRIFNIGSVNYVDVTDEYKTLFGLNNSYKKTGIIGDVPSFSELSSLPDIYKLNTSLSNTISPISSDGSTEYLLVFDIDESALGASLNQIYLYDSVNSEGYSFTSPNPYLTLCYESEDLCGLKLFIKAKNKVEIRIKFNDEIAFDDYQSVRLNARVKETSATDKARGQAAYGQDFLSRPFTIVSTDKGDTAYYTYQNDGRGRLWNLANGIYTIDTDLIQEATTTQKNGTTLTDIETLDYVSIVHTPWYLMGYNGDFDGIDVITYLDGIIVTMK